MGLRSVSARKWRVAPPSPTEPSKKTRAGFDCPFRARERKENSSGETSLARTHMHVFHARPCTLHHHRRRQRLSLSVSACPTVKRGKTFRDIRFPSYLRDRISDSGTRSFPPEHDRLIVPTFNSSLRDLAEITDTSTTRWRTLGDGDGCMQLRLQLPSPPPPRPHP
jgi:hypothetical protein